MRPGYSFTITAKDPESRARTGLLQTPRGPIETPAYLPVGTAATVKAVTGADLQRAGVPMILANTYHLALRPGSDVIKRAGGLHAFMGWDRPILTDSGGFQVFSLSPFREVTDDGVRFRSHLDGTELWLGPEEAMRIQEDLDSDIILPLDVCTPNPCPKEEVAEALRRTHLWAERSLEAHGDRTAALFGIVQGGTYADLRAESAEHVGALGFDGLAVGGLSVGEDRSELADVLRDLRLPAALPVHLLGVGMPEDLFVGIAAGMDTFDCVIPTRNARGAGLFTFDGRLHMKNARFAEDFEPVEADCPCPTCTGHTRAYLRHLYQAGEMLAAVLGTVHNLTFFQRLMGRIRQAIQDGRLDAYRVEFLGRYLGDGEA